MIIDNSQLFTGTSNGASGGITASANTDAPTVTAFATNTIDYGLLSGIPSGGAAPNSANRDMGIGDSPSLKVSAVVTTAFTGGTSMAVEIWGIPDNSSGASGTAYLMCTGPVVATADLVAGAQLGNFDMPREIPLIGPVRYIQLKYLIVGTLTPGAIEAWIALDQMQQIIGPSAASPLSGYPAGINIAN